MTEIDGDAEILEAVAAFHEIHRLAKASDDNPRAWIDSIIAGGSDPESPLYVLWRWREGGSLKYRRQRVRDFLRRLYADREVGEAATPRGH